MKYLIFLVALAGLNVSGPSQQSTRWRGPAGNGIYPENGLLKQWPTGGPAVLRSYGELGQGHSSAVVREGFVYTTGMTDETGYLFKFTVDGRLVYRKPYGPEFTQSWYGTRGSPVVVGDRI